MLILSKYHNVWWQSRTFEQLFYFANHTYANSAMENVGETLASSDQGTENIKFPEGHKTIQISHNRDKESPKVIEVSVAKRDVETSEKVKINENPCKNEERIKISRSHHS